MANTTIERRPRPSSAPTITLSCYFLIHLLLWSSSAPSPVSSQGAAAAGADAERRALLQMKAAWGNPQSLTSWNSSSSPCADAWTGVECGEDGSVTGISLVNQDIYGDVPAATCDLRNLSSLNLYNNFVGGEFPTALYNCSGLRFLNLSQNLFVGAIPADVHRLSRLEVLDLSYNNFSGDVPVALGRITGLRRLQLERNLLNGTFPKELGGLAKLESLSLGGNPFKPMALPADFGNLGSLQFLWVGEANLVGEIPESLGNLAQLQRLDLSMNNLKGGIPGRIWQLQQLRVLYLYDNHLSGRIAAAGTFSATNLTMIDLSMNQLSGPIPEEFAKQRNLSILFLYINHLSGPIPSGLAGIPTLYDIRLFNNNLTGVLPAELGKKSKLLSLEVCGNRLSGELPGNLCAGGTLNTLVVFNNKFTGDLPKSLGDCKSLQNLQVYGNDFSGDVPAGIWTLPILTVVLMHGNSLSGELPRTLPRNLSRMDIENNKFSGRLPSRAPSLKVLRGSNNMFSGEIPADLTGSGDTKPAAPSHDRRPRDLFVLFPVLGGVLFIAVLLLGFYLVRKFWRGKTGGGISSWKLTSFQTSLDFSKIICGLTADNLVGRGGLGQVYRVQLGDDGSGEVIAVKQISNKKLRLKLGKKFENDVKVLGSIRHANIAKLLCYVSCADSKLLVYEYVENGSLHEWLHGERRDSLMAGGGSMAQQGFLDWPARLSIAVGTARGLCYIHHDCSPSVVHRNVKSSNILLDGDLNPKVADFGLARMLLRSRELQSFSAVAGSLPYMAPECAYSRNVNEKVDVYSFGVVLLELTTGRRANDGGGGEGSLADWAWRHFQEDNSVAEAVDERVGGPLYMEEMAVVLRLGIVCTGTLPSTRPSMEEVLQVLLRCSQAHGGCGGEPDPAQVAENKGNCRERQPPDAGD
ncbi:hypothetical protein Taro_028761, partial [Colocasia esculenta]|nr:hypothetical protein [Colocasia esculenta]